MAGPLERTMGGLGGGQTPGEIELLGSQASYATPPPWRDGPQPSQRAPQAVPPPPWVQGGAPQQTPPTAPQAAAADVQGPYNSLTGDFVSGALSETMKTLRMIPDLVDYKNETLDGWIDALDKNADDSDWGDYGRYGAIAASLAVPGMAGLKLYRGARGMAGRSLRKALRAAAQDVKEGSPGVGGRAPRGRRS